MLVRSNHFPLLCWILTDWASTRPFFACPIFLKAMLCFTYMIRPPPGNSASARSALIAVYPFRSGVALFVVSLVSCSFVVVMDI